MAAVPLKSNCYPVLGDIWQYPEPWDEEMKPMSKDETIQELREKLARTEGERDAWKEAAKAEPWPVAPVPQPYIMCQRHYCANCGSWYIGSHCCMYGSPYRYSPPYIGPITICSTGSSTNMAQSVMGNLTGQSLAASMSQALVGLVT